jgi:predicted nucleic acid-binding protein
VSATQEPHRTPPEPGKVVVVDATVIIHLTKAGRLDLLGTLEGWDFVVPDQVVEEVTYAEQAAALAAALAAGHLRRESSTDLAEIALYAELKGERTMGKGDAACLAMAASRGWLLASDDRGRAFRRLGDISRSLPWAPFPSSSISALASATRFR